MFTNLLQISNFTSLRKLLCETRRKRLASLNSLLILTIPSALLLLGTKKKMIPMTTRKVSTLFQRSAKKFYGPIATILMTSSAKNIQTNILSKISMSLEYSNIKYIALIKERIMMIETASSKPQCFTIYLR